MSSAPSGSRRRIIASLLLTVAALSTHSVADGEEVLKLVTLSSTETTAMISSMAEDVENDRLTTIDEMRKRLRSERDQIAVQIEEARKKAAGVAKE